MLGVDASPKLLHLAAQTQKFLRHGVVIMNLVKFGRTLTCHANYLCRHANRCCIGGNLTEHNRTCGYAGIVAHGKGAEHLCSCAHKHISSQRGVTLALILTRRTSFP